jgi:outer membrane lipoprotein-sorting protein
MVRSSLLSLAILTGFSSIAQYPGFSPLPTNSPFKEQFAAASQKINTLTCDFVQEKDLSMLSEKIVSKGRFWFKKDKLIRMEYIDPFPYLMILNNDNVYIKDGQKENRISTRSNPLFRQVNSIMIDCVRGTALGSPNFSVNLFEGNSAYLIELTPLSKSLKEFFKNIQIQVDKKDYSVRVIQMIELSGDSTTIHFINKDLNSPIPDALFIIH